MRRKGDGRRILPLCGLPTILLAPLRATTLQKCPRFWGGVSKSQCRLVLLRKAQIATLYCNASQHLMSMTAKLTHQLNTGTFYALSCARCNVFQAQHNADKFGFTGSGVNCKLLTESISPAELGSNSCVHLSEYLNG